MSEKTPEKTGEKNSPAGNPPPEWPAWAREIVALYESNAYSQFVLYGNVQDRMVLPLGDKTRLGMLEEFLIEVLLPRFDVVLSYDLGNGIRVEKGDKVFAGWPGLREIGELPKNPRTAIETLTRYFRYIANLERLGKGRNQVACFIKSAHLLAPATFGGVNYDLSALALLIKEWGSDWLLSEHSIATFLITENLNDLHPILANQPGAAQIKLGLPTPDELREALELLKKNNPTALSEFSQNLEMPARQLAGATLGSIESLIKLKEREKKPLTSEDLFGLKKKLVEKDCSGLIEFIDSKRTLDDLYGQEKVKAWLRQDIALLAKDDRDAIPMGYLLCGPVGTGKTFMVECLAGEAKIPVVKLKNFRDKWVGSTEGNLEKIFRLIEALGRCYVFIDEADQSLGKRDSGSNDAGLSGRIYSMIAQQMSDAKNRGKIIWILASSRPDLIEVDLKRPGRVDIKIPLFPTTTAEESFCLIQTLCKRRGVPLPASAKAGLEKLLPLWLTPGAAEAIAVKVYRGVKTKSQTPEAALADCLDDYQNPVPADIMAFQIKLAVQEASDLEFVPAVLRGK